MLPEPMVRGVPLPTVLAQASVEDLFRDAGALREGHFRLKSGLHSARYLEKFLVLQYPTLASELCRRMAEEVIRDAPNVVVGPTTGGVLLAFETARHLSARLGWEVRGLFAEPAGEGGRELRRGFEVSRGDTVVLVDDILTTGSSLLETADAVERAGGRASAAVVMVDRSTEPVDIGVPVRAVGRIEIATWQPRYCPLCQAGDWLETPGSGWAT